MFIAWIKSIATKAGKLFVDANYLAQMAHFAWAAMWCYGFTFWMVHAHVLSARIAVSIALGAWMILWATPKEFWFDTVFEGASFWDNALDWASYFAGCLSVLIPVLIFCSSAHAQARPDAKLTPGVIRTTSAAEICAPTFRTKPYRHTTPAMKKHVCLEYGVKTGCPGQKQEIDHLVPLELGGLDDVRNLWPQPYTVPGAHQKDLVENRLHKMVCAGEIKLPDAQHMLQSDWYQAYKQLGFSKAK